MEFAEYLRPIRQHARALSVLCLSAAMLAFVLTYVLRDSYEATALILVKPNDNLHISSGSGKDDKELLNFPVAVAKVEVAANTYVEVIKSRAVVEKVVRRLKLDVEEETPAKNAFQRVIEAVRKPVREYSYIPTQFLKYGRVIGKLPPFDKALDTLERGLSVAALKETYLFEINYEADTAEKAAAVANAVADLFVQHMSELGAPFTKSTLGFLEDRLTASLGEVADARGAIREFKQVNRTISFKEETTEDIKIISDLEVQLEKIELKLVNYLQLYTPLNPKVQSVQAERDRLDAALRARRKQLTERPAKERNLLALTLNLQVAEEIYQLINKEYEEARIRTGKQINEIKIISQAKPPVSPAKPSRISYAGSAFLLALLLGVGWIYLREYLDTSIRRVADVERVLQVPVLATLPVTPPAPAPGRRGRGGDGNGSDRPVSPPAARHAVRAP
jgi:uncharacterized protein involved in exopolysaccharide biosynthesis